MKTRLEIIAFLEDRIQEHQGNERNVRSLNESIRKHLLAGLRHFIGVKIPTELSPTFIYDDCGFDSPYTIEEVIGGNEYEVTIKCKETDFDFTFEKMIFLDQSGKYQNDKGYSNLTNDEMKEIYLTLLKLSA